MKMPTDAQKKAARKYQEARERVTLWIDPMEKEQWQKMANDSGRSLTQFIKDCVDAVGDDLLPMPTPPKVFIHREDVETLE